MSIGGPFDCYPPGACPCWFSWPYCCRLAAQGMALSENSRSEVEAEGRQPGPATQDAPPNSDPADNHSHRDNNASGKGIE